MKFFLLSLFTLLSFNCFASTHQTINSQHSQITFSVHYMNVIPVKGFFKDLHGGFKLANETHLEKLFIYIPIKGISTNHAARDRHLKSPEFFHGDRYPFIKIHLDRFELKENKKIQKIINLEIKGIKKKVPVQITYKGKKADPWNKKKHSHFFTLKTEINRRNYNLTFDKKTEIGDAVVDDIIHITGTVETNPTDQKLAFSRFFVPKNFAKKPSPAPKLQNKPAENKKKQNCDCDCDCNDLKKQIEKLERDKAAAYAMIKPVPASKFKLSDYLISFSLFVILSILIFGLKYLLINYLKKYFKHEKTIEFISDLIALGLLCYLLFALLPIMGYR